MNTNEPSASQCQRCGAALAADAAEGLCPRCLLALNLGPQTQLTGEDPTGRRPTEPPAIADLAPLFPQLEILELLGRGGMGAVYRARQKQLDRIVALKILPPGVGSDTAFAARFATEARALAKLNHPNIVTIHDFGCVSTAATLPSPPGTRTSSSATSTSTPDTLHSSLATLSAPLFFFVMEFVDGMNLRQLMAAGRLAPREALAIVPQICDALQYAHDAGIVHRDIKPENILLDRRGRVKVADFGLAKLVGQADTGLSDGSASSIGNRQSTVGNVIMGTPQYMAPEQREHPTDVDHRADIYSLGVVFYQMLTGELPQGDFAAPSKKVVVDVRLDEVVLRALERRPELRYQQVSDVKTLVETITGTPLLGQTPTASPGACHAAASAAAPYYHRASAFRERWSWDATFIWCATALLVPLPGILAACLVAALGAKALFFLLLGLIPLLNAIINFAVLRRVERLREHVPADALEMAEVLYAAQTTQSPCLAILAADRLELRLVTGAPVTIPLSDIESVTEMRWLSGRRLWWKRGLKIRRRSAPAVVLALAEPVFQRWQPFLAGAIRQLNTPPAESVATPSTVESRARIFTRNIILVFGMAFGVVALPLALASPYPWKQFGLICAPIMIVVSFLRLIGKGPFSALLSPAGAPQPPVPTLGKTGGADCEAFEKASAGGRLVYAVFVLLYLVLTVGLLFTAAWLPERVATHFGLAGRPNGWMSRAHFLAFGAAFPLLLALFFAGISALIKILPARFCNIPNRAFWLAPERRVTTVVRIRHWLAGLLCLMTLFFAGLHVLTIVANRSTPPQLPMGGLMLLVIVFLLALMIWLTMFLMRFAEIRNAGESVPSAPLPCLREKDAPDFQRAEAKEAEPRAGGWWRIVMSVLWQGAAALPLLFFSMFIVPKFDELARRNKLMLPGLSNLVVRVSNFVNGNYWVDYACLLATILIGWALWRSGGAQRLRRWTTSVVTILFALFVGCVAAVIIPVLCSAPRLFQGAPAATASVPTAVPALAAAVMPAAGTGVIEGGQPNWFMWLLVGLAIVAGVIVALMLRVARKHGRCAAVPPPVPSHWNNVAPAFPHDSARGGPSLEINAHAKRCGKWALRLCASGLVVPAFLLALRLPPQTRLGALLWLGIFVFTSLCEIAAIVLGIMGWKSGAGKAAVIVAAVLPFLVVPGSLLAVFWMRTAQVRWQAGEEQNRAYLEQVEAKLRVMTQQQLGKFSVRCDHIKVIVSPTYDLATILLANPQELRGVGGSNIWTNIEGLLTARPKGDGCWEVQGDQQLGHIRFTVKVPVIERLILPVGQAPDKVQVIFHGDREALTGKLQAELERQFASGGASCADLQVAVGENLDSATVSYRQLQNFTNAAGAKLTYTQGHFMLRPDGHGLWLGQLGDVPLTVRVGDVTRAAALLNTNSNSNQPEK